MIRQNIILKEQLHNFFYAHQGQVVILDELREEMPDVNEKSVRDYVGAFANEANPNGDYWEGFNRVGRGAYQFDPPIKPMDERLLLMNEQLWNLPYWQIPDRKRTAASQVRRIPLTPGRRNALYARQGRRCPICGLTAERIYLLNHADHIMAISHGGEQLYNVQLTHTACNIRKRAHSMREVWEQAMGWMQPDGKPLLEERNLPFAQRAHMLALEWCDEWRRQV